MTRFRPRKIVAELTSFRAAQREGEINARCRLDEVRAVLHYGSVADRKTYRAASAAWDEAGQPNVPFITEWFATCGNGGRTDDESR
jgi:hypothetical protein